MLLTKKEISARLAGLWEQIAKADNLRSETRAFEAPAGTVEVFVQRIYVRGGRFAWKPYWKARLNGKTILDGIEHKSTTIDIIARKGNAAAA
jgi:hypothetical protein